MLSKKDKLLQIHIPKTGGTSFRKALLPDITETRHELAGDFDAKTWERNFTFAVVRNPFERALSQYVFHCHGRYQGVLLRSHPDLKGLSFEAYLRRYVVRKARKMFYPQVDYIVHPVSTKPIDFLGRFETLAEDFRRLLAELGREPMKLPHAQASNHDHYSRYYDATTRELVQRAYSVDLDELGYSFEEE